MNVPSEAPTARCPASTRRAFLQRSGLGLGALVLPGVPTRGAGVVRLGVVGIGRAGRRHLQRFLELPGCKVLAVCDVYESRQEWGRSRVNAAYGNKDCNTFTDFRDLLRSEELDALVIAAPDHWHAWMTIAAFRAGLDVFCESPGMRTLDEGRELQVMQERTGRILQVAMPWRDHHNVDRARRLVRDGRLGTLSKVVGEMDRGRAFERIAARPYRVPGDLNYDLWLGPAPATPYHPKRCEGFRWIRDYAAGRVSEQGLVLLDLAGSILHVEPTAETRIQASGKRPSRGLFDNPVDVTSSLRVGGGAPWTLATGSGFGLTLIGTKGKLRFSPRTGKLVGLGEEWQGRAGAAPEPESPPDLAVDFLQAVRQRRQPRCALTVARRAASWSYGVEIGIEVGREVRLSAAGQVLGDARAARLGQRARRPQWTMKM